MNCHDFDAILLELVRGEAASSAMAEGQAHAASCARCAALLSGQQSLSVGLEALAARAKEDRPPQRIERALRAEFRRQHARAPKRGPSVLSPFRIFGSRTAWGLAAIVIAVVGGVLAAKFRMKSKATPRTQTQPQRAMQLSAPRLPVVAAVNPQPVSGHPATRRAARRSGSHPRALARPLPAPAHAQNSGDEWTTSFYPLPYGSGLDLDEGWETVRVSMPVSALASLGVPLINEGSSTQIVKADVVLGGDGMARAIRFVQ